ncbi:MAG: hypothetical protein IJH70_13150 [Oscillospiraceae bacterium]|nr:hypothetical protein [Oscillospiraceae bacterium]
MTTTLFILTAAALVAVVLQNRRLALRLAALAAAQNETEKRLDRLSKRTRKQTNTARKQEAKIERLHRKQREQADRQKRVEAEQRKQAQTISKLTFRIAQAEADIAAAKDRLTGLCAVLDCIKEQQAGTVPGSPADIRLARQAVVLESQIATAERKLARSLFDRQQAKEGLAA